jgi:hypothetical protein
VHDVGLNGVRASRKTFRNVIDGDDPFSSSVWEEGLAFELTLGSPGEVESPAHVTCGGSSTEKGLTEAMDDGIFLGAGLQVVFIVHTAIDGVLPCAAIAVLSTSSSLVLSFSLGHVEKRSYLEGVVDEGTRVWLAACLTVWKEDGIIGLGLGIPLPEAMSSEDERNRNTDDSSRLENVALGIAFLFDDNFHSGSGVNDW